MDVHLQYGCREEESPPRRLFARHCQGIMGSFCFGTEFKKIIIIIIKLALAPRSRQVKLGTKKIIMKMWKQYTSALCEWYCSHHSPSASGLYNFFIWLNARGQLFHVVECPRLTSSCGWMPGANLLMWLDAVANSWCGWMPLPTSWCGWMPGVNSFIWMGLIVDFQYYFWLDAHPSLQISGSYPCRRPHPPFFFSLSSALHWPEVHDVITKTSMFDNRGSTVFENPKK